jgi:metal-responsive CopG/Arc/MetJ family transcriptional regulator
VSLTARGARLGPLVRTSAFGYTYGMKTAISVPEDVYTEAERLAQRLQISRSELYSRAVHEFVCRHAPDRVTETLDRVIEELEPGSDGFVAEATRRALERAEWE